MTTDLETASASDNRIHVAFLFERQFAFPPNIDDMKVFYISRELLRRGAMVSWVQFKGNPGSKREAEIEFVTIPFRENSGPLRPFLMIFSVLSFCLFSNVTCVYIDEWLMFRGRMFWQLVLRAVLKIARLQVVFDLRDPYIDYQIAYGKLRPGSWRHALLRLQYALIFKLTDLVVLPSQVYAQVYSDEEGIPSERILGIPRGIDSTLFNPEVDSESIKKELGLEGKFVIGWFGMMHRYRLVNEVLIPLIRDINKFMPDAHILIGGKGDLQEEFVRLKNERKDAPFTFLGLVPYAELPKYIAACDVLLSPIDPSFRFTRHSVWLKILESLAVGRPIIATRTRLTDGDFRNLKGIVWTGSDLRSFTAALREVRNNYSHYHSLASNQAAHFQDYSTRRTISRLVDRIVSMR